MLLASKFYDKKQHVLRASKLLPHDNTYSGFQSLTARKHMILLRLPNLTEKQHMLRIPNFNRITTLAQGFKIFNHMTSGA
jgi:hypothetical protein